MKMAEYVGLDVSMKETAVSIRRDGKRIWRGKCGSDPKLVAEVIRRRAPDAARVVFETGPLSVWFFHTLTAEGLPAICINDLPGRVDSLLVLLVRDLASMFLYAVAGLAEQAIFRLARLKDPSHRCSDREPHGSKEHRVLSQVGDPSLELPADVRGRSAATSPALGG